jgi:hypothetical protein
LRDSCGSATEMGGGSEHRARYSSRGSKIVVARGKIRRTRYEAGIKMKISRLSKRVRKFFRERCGCGSSVG